MTVQFHGDRHAGRAVGRPRTGLLSSRDPVTVAKAAKQLIQSGHWQQQAGGDDRTRVLVSLGSRLPFAVGLFPVDALVALTKVPPPGGCHWCAALLQVVPDRPELDRTPALLALLGEGCRTCQHRWAVDARVTELIETFTLEAREARRHAAGRVPDPLVAATPPPPAPARTSTWPAPVPVTRVPAPHYWTRRPWPPEDTGGPRTTLTGW